MEKSIETIWKSGFLDSNALVAPKVNDLYNRKSVHVIEKFERMFRFNLKALAIGGILGWVGLTLLQLPITGAVLFLTLMAVLFVNRKKWKDLKQIDRSVSSFEYLSSFDRWMKDQISSNRKMARFYYPILFLGTALGLWFSVHGPHLLELFGRPESSWQINGIPGVFIFPILFLTALLGIFGGRLYDLEMSAFYGRVLRKLDELLADMKTLREETPR